MSCTYKLRYRYRGRMGMHLCPSCAYGILTLNGRQADQNGCERVLRLDMDRHRDRISDTGHRRCEFIQWSLAPDDERKLFRRSCGIPRRRRLRRNPAGCGRVPSTGRNFGRILPHHTVRASFFVDIPFQDSASLAIMPIVERDLTDFHLRSPAPEAGTSIDNFTLVSSRRTIYKDFTWTLTFPLPNTHRVLLTGPDRPRPPQDNVILKYEPLTFKIISLDTDACTAVFAYPDSSRDDLDGSDKTRELHLDWSDQIVLSSWEVDAASQSSPTRLLGDVPVRSYALTVHGIIRHYSIDRKRLHLGLGERAAPLDLTGRSFQMNGTNAGGYDAWESDPLYKHTPFLISAPRGDASSTYAVYHPTNSNAQWDVNRLGDVPSTRFMSYTQDYGGLEEWAMVGKGVKEVVRTFAEIVGKPRLVGRDWLGYLGE